MEIPHRGKNPRLCVSAGFDGAHLPDEKVILPVKNKLLSPVTGKIRAVEFPEQVGFRARRHEECPAPCTGPDNQVIGPFEAGRSPAAAERTGAGSQFSEIPGGNPQIERRKNSD